VDRSFTCRIETDFGELSKHSEQWRHLHSLSDQCEIFQHFAWIRAWWDSFGGGRLFTPIVSDHSGIVGILPLMLDGRRLRFLGHSVSDYVHFLVSPENAAAALEHSLAALSQRSEQWDEIVLDNVPESSSLARALRQLSAESRNGIVVSPGEPCPTLLLRERKQQTLDSLLSKDKLKKTVRYLARRGQLTFHHIEDPKEVAIHLPQFALQHSRRSVFAGRRSAFQDEAYFSFYKKLCVELDLRTELRFSVLKVDDRPVAYHFGTLWRSKYLFYKPTFEVDLWELSPGQVLLWHLFDHLKSTDVDEFDFGQGGETYKSRFSNQVRQNLNFRIYRASFAGARRRSLMRAREAAKRTVKETPALNGFANSLRALHEEASVAHRRSGALGVASQLWSRLVLAREEVWLLHAGRHAPDAGAENFGQGARTLTLADLADLAIATPRAFTDAMLHDARRLLQHGGCALRIGSENGPSAVLWTTLGDKLATPMREIQLPQTSLLVHDIWPMASGWNEQVAASCLRSVLTLAREKESPLYAVLPRRRLPALPTLRALGLELQSRMVCTRVFGRTRWRELPQQSVVP
jgi:CelD/BcsL family acetyltransferase involved in cellulose biosynthesis